MSRLLARLPGVRLVAAGGAALAALVAAIVVTVAVHERAQILAAHHERAALLARLVEARVTRILDAASRTADAAAASVATLPADRLADAGAALARARGAAPEVGDLLLLDARGRVVAASSPAWRGRSFAAWVAPERAASGTAAPPAAGGALPLVRGVARADATRLTLVALVDRARLDDALREAIAGSDESAFVATADGRVVAATRERDRRAALPDAARAAADGPAREGRGDAAVAAPGRPLAAWRTVPARGLVVVVEEGHDAVLAHWRGLLRWLVLGGGAALAAIGVLTAVSVRSLQAREAARRQRAAAQQAIALRERELSVVAKSVQELLFRTDAGGTLTFVNARWEAATGQPAAKLLGRSLAELVEPASRAAISALLTPSEPGTRGRQVVLAGAAAREFELTVSPLLEAGRVVGFAGSAVDVTERSAAQRELQAQLALSATMLDTIPLPVALLDADGRYVTVNRAWEGHAGIAREALSGRTASSYLPPAEAVAHERRSRDALDDARPVRYECEATAADGSRRTVSVTKAPVPGADGRPQGLVVTLLDISEFREADRAMREARDIAEEASRAKSEFIANISHELRTPLQAIIGFSELGMMRGRAAPKLASMFEDIHAGGQRMLALVNDLLDVSKIESTVGTFHLERTDLRPLVREVTRELTPLLASRRLHLELRLEDVPLIAKVDPLRFQQVVRNILANAVKFSPDGAAIDVDGELDSHGQVVLSVRDRGPGIPPTELETIFEAFVQSSKTKDGSGGTGLGLAICRKIVEAHGGRVRAENVDGGGSRFTLVLPARGFSDTVV